MIRVSSHLHVVGETLDHEPILNLNLGSLFTGFHEGQPTKSKAAVKTKRAAAWPPAEPPRTPQQRVRAWKRRCDALLEVIPDLILRLRSDGTYLDYHEPPQFPAVTPPYRVVGRRVQDILPPDVGQMRMAAIERALATGRVQRIQYELRMGGARRLREERIAPSARDEVVVDVRDVTRSRQTEAAVHVLQEDLRSVLENIPDLVAALAPDGTVLFVNCEPTRKPLVGTSIYQHVVPGGHDNVRAAIEHVASTGQSSSFDVVATGPLGEGRSYACRLGAVTREGRVTGLTLVARDVTEREQVLDALRESEQRYRGLVEGSRDAIFVTMRDGRVVDFNQAALDLFGYTRDDLPSINVTALYCDAADRGRFRAAIERAGSVRDYEVKLRRRDGTELIGLLTATVRTTKDGTIVGYQGIVRDVTERRRLEREVLKSVEREQRRIGQDLHDGLGQHLTGVAFLARVLSQKLAAKGTAESADAAKIGALIEQAIARTRDLAKGLLPVTLGTDGLALALEEMCRNTAQTFGRPCECRIAADVCVEDSNIATNVYHIAREAVTNAVKHSHGRSIQIQLDASNGTGILVVRDDGVGLRPTGSGKRSLGLRIMRYRAEIVGGSLEVQDRHGGGTEVRCVFPILRSPTRGGRS